MDVKGLKIEEDVEVHQSERYLKIEIPATRNKSAVTIIHHFGQVKLYNLFLIVCVLNPSYSHICVWNYCNWNTSTCIIPFHIFQNLTQYRQAGQCFLLSNFHAFAMGMDDWMQVNCSLQVIKFFQMFPLMIHSFHSLAISLNFIILPFQ